MEIIIAIRKHWRPQLGWQPIILFLWVICFSFGPRIELFGLPGDFRIQELTFLPGLIVFYFYVDMRNLLTKRGNADLPALLLWLTVAVFLASVLLVVGMSTSNQDLVIRLGFLLRYFEIFATGTLVVRLLRADLQAGSVAILIGLAVGGISNAVWIVSQLVSGVHGPAYSFSSTIPSMYGPALIGEGGVFGSGQYLTILAATLMSAYFVHSRRPTALFLLLSLATVFFFQLQVNSRTSILATVVMGCFVTATLVSGLLQRTQKRFLIPVFVGVGTFGAALTVLAVPRLGPAPVVAGLKARFDTWHSPIFEALSTNFLLGLGPGGARIAAAGESHGLYMMVLGDFGLLGLAAFLVLVLLLISSVRKTIFTAKTRQAQFLGLLAMILVINYLVSGVAQDALLPVNTTHLSSTLIGLYFAHASGRKSDAESSEDLTLPTRYRTNGRPDAHDTC